MFSGVTLLQSNGTKGVFITVTSRKFFYKLACEQASMRGWKRIQQAKQAQQGRGVCRHFIDAVFHENRIWYHALIG